MSDWTDVGERSQVDADNPLGVAVGATKIGIYEVDGDLHAVEDVCPDAYALLTQGFADGWAVECPLHNAVFDATTGKHLRGEPCRDIRTYPIRISNQGRIEVQA